MRDGLIKEAHFTAQAQCSMTLVHLCIAMFHVKFVGGYVGKVNHLRTSCSMGAVDFYNCMNPK